MHFNTNCSPAEGLKGVYSGFSSSIIGMKYIGMLYNMQS